MVRSLVSALSFSTVLLHSCVVHVQHGTRYKAKHGQKKGHAPRAKGGALIHGHLKVAIKGATDTNTDLVLRSVAK